MQTLNHRSEEKNNEDAVEIFMTGKKSFRRDAQREQGRERERAAEEKGKSKFIKPDARQNEDNLFA